MTKTEVKPAVGARLREAIEARGITQAEAARRVGIGATRLSNYLSGFREADYATLAKMCRAFGVTPDELFGFSDTYVQRVECGITEVDVRGGAGLGGEAAVENFSEGASTVSRDVAKGEWLLPHDYLSEIRVSAKDVRIIEICGDSMERPDGGGLHPGDRVMVALTDRNPTPPGIFALWDGFGIVVKRIERVPKSEPPALRLISDNPAHESYVLTADEVNIIGRVIWYARRI